MVATDIGSPISTADAYPDQYVQTLCPPIPSPAFETPDEMRRVWGENWGASDEVGPLRVVLMRRPAEEMRRVRADCWDERA